LYKTRKVIYSLISKVKSDELQAFNTKTKWEKHE
jgi:hypothetical protein